MKFERIVEFSPAFDKRHKDPSKDYGICAVTIKFILKKGTQAVHFFMGTNLYLPSTIEEYKRIGNKGKTPPLNLMVELGDASGLNGLDLGYHSPKPMYKGQNIIDDKCPYIGRKCYYDGRSLNAKPLIEILLTEGSEGIWKKLEEYFDVTFGGK